MTAFCSCCDFRMEFISPTIRELENWGFYYWGNCKDGTPYLTCDKCTKELEREMGIIRKEFTPASAKITVLDKKMDKNSYAHKTSDSPKPKAKRILYREV